MAACEIDRAGVSSRTALESRLDGVEIAMRGGLHEWFGTGAASEQGPRRDRFWLPPMALLIGMAWEAVEADPRRRVIWIGRRCWPYPPALMRHGADRFDRRLLERSVFVETEASRAGHGERVWAIELAARCAGVGAVVADGSGLTMAESRRLQLAAAVSERTATPLLLARPPWEERELSAARTRWRVSPLPFIDDTHNENGQRQGWALELLRCKGLRTERATEDARRWAVRRDHATGHITMEHIDRSAGDDDLVADMVNGLGAKAGPRIA